MTTIPPVMLRFAPALTSKPARLEIAFPSVEMVIVPPDKLAVPSAMTRFPMVLIDPPSI
jgi:hypothetical protein